MNILGLLWLVGYAAIFKGFAYPTVYGEVGGEVLFLCPCDKERPVNSFYFQGFHGPDKVFINGWHDTKRTKPKPDLFTSVNRTERTVTMWNLTAGNEGFYQFFIDYSNETKEYSIFLNVSEKPTTTRSGEQQPIHSSEAEQSHRHHWYFLAAGCLFVLLLVVIILHVVATRRQHSAPGASPSGASGGAPEEP